MVFSTWLSELLKFTDVVIINKSKIQFESKSQQVKLEKHFYIDKNTVKPSSSLSNLFWYF